MSFVSTDPQNHCGDNTWFTPKFIIDDLGPFDTDVCTTIKRPFNTARNHIEVENEDSLKKEWNGFIWMNPPYGKEISPFIEKFINHNNGIALVFSRMDTEWMQKYIRNGGKIFFLRKRIKFINRNGETLTNAGTGSCLLIAGEIALSRIKITSLNGVMYE